MNDLDRGGASFPIKTDAQNLVPSDDAFPCAHQRLDVERFRQAAEDLLHVDAVVRGIDAVEKHSLLHRRERVPEIEDARRIGRRRIGHYPARLSIENRDLPCQWVCRRARWCKEVTRRSEFIPAIVS